MSVKVFELAKELDVGAVDLVVKLRGLGLNVRNHMVALSDDEEAQARAALIPQPASPTTKKKKAVRKKVSKKVASSVSATVAKKKKVVIKRKKSTAKPSPQENEEIEKVASTPESVPVSPTPAVAPLQDDSVEQRSETPDKAQIAAKQTASGREALAKQESKTSVKPAASREVVIEEVDETGSKKGDPDDSSDSLLRPKLHSFTPIFIPEEKKTESKTTPEGTTGNSEEDETKGKSKKRLGSLAAIVNKKGASDKAKDLNLFRAEEEMKFASTIVGRAIYTPARKKKVYSGATKQTLITDIKDSKRVVVLKGGANSEDLAQKLAVKFEDLQNKVLDMNLLIKRTDFVGIKLAEKIAELYEYRVEDRAFKEEELLNTNGEQIDNESLPIRDPIIAVMGHVDHGKTTLLDTIRKAEVASGEAGGITQHIGAYSVKSKNRTLTFLDTPGHAAFAAMRSRGAQVTDIVVLVVAADDGVMPQTRESIRFCQDAGVPIIVAVNKMDKEDANPDRIKQELTEFEITPEEWGGETQFVPISALKGEGIDKLLESIELQTEIMELRASDQGVAEGIVIESNMETGRGPIATVLVQSGVLHKGDSVVVGETYGRARSLMDYAGNMLKSAGPSTPVEILGLGEVPSPGDQLNVVKNEREAKKIAQNRIDERKLLENTEQNKPKALEDFFSDAAAAEGLTKMTLVIRADVQGSFEAIKNSLEVLGNDEVRVEVISGGVGAITDNDVMLASSTGGYIIGFNMRPVTSARKLAEQKQVDVKTYSVIYELIQDVKLALEGMLEPEYVEKFLGRAQVKEVFQIPKIGAIAGSVVVDGRIERGANLRLLRDGKIIHDGKISSLRRFKDDVKEVKNGMECGVAMDGHTDIRPNDIFEAYTVEEKSRTLDSPARSGEDRQYEGRA